MTYIPGDYWMCADCCGQKKRRSQMVKQWDGAWVCRNHVDYRHPQELMRPKVDDQSVFPSRPEPKDVFIGDIEDGGFLGIPDFLAEDDILNVGT